MPHRAKFFSQLQAFTSEARRAIEPGCRLGLLFDSALAQARTFNQPTEYYYLATAKADTLTEQAIDFIHARLSTRA